VDEVNIFFGVDETNRRCHPKGKSNNTTVVNHFAITRSFFKMRAPQSAKKNQKTK